MKFFLQVLYTELRLGYPLIYLHRLFFAAFRSRFLSTAVETDANPSCHCFYQNTAQKHGVIELLILYAYIASVLPAFRFWRLKLSVLRRLWRCYSLLGSKYSIFRLCISCNRFSLNFREFSLEFILLLCMLRVNKSLRLSLVCKFR